MKNKHFNHLEAEMEKNRRKMRVWRARKFFPI